MGQEALRDGGIIGVVDHQQPAQGRRFERLADRRPPVGPKQDDTGELFAALIEQFRTADVAATPVFVAGRRGAALVGWAMVLLAEAVRWLVPHDDFNAHAAAGYLSAERFLCSITGCSSDRAAGIMRVVRFCSAHAKTGQALSGGSVSFDQVEVLARYAHDLSDEYTGSGDDMLTLCADHDVEALGRQVRLWRWRVRPDTSAADTERAWNARSCTLQSDLFGGVSGRFRLDAAGGEILASALDTPPDPDGPVPPRSLGQRRADALSRSRSRPRSRRHHRASRAARRRRTYRRSR